MKVRSFPGPRVLAATVAQGRSLLVAVGRQTRRHRGWSLATLGAGAPAFALVYPHDHAWLAALHFWPARQEQAAHRIAYFFGTWGDYPTYNVPVAVLAWLYGLRRGRGAWRRIGLVAFFGATLAGGADDCLRLTLGRPRPDSHVPDGFYGIVHAMHGGYQSFPSGHAASVIGMAVALLFVTRALGIPTLLYGLTVLWARMELYRHYPSDVLVGSILGLSIGLLVGLAAARPRPLNRRSEPAPRGNR